MAPALTGDAAALYMGAMFDSANRRHSMNAAALARDARAGSRRALARLRMATVFVRQAVLPTVSDSPRPRGRRSPQSRRVSAPRAARSKPRLSNTSLAACDAISGPPSVQVGL